MRTHLGRPVEFEALKQEKFCMLVEVGVSRRNAAASVGVAPSTVSRRMEADPLFAEKVLEAEMECEVHLLSRIRLQSERSWRAAVWLLERMRPERYARGKAAPSGSSWDEMFGKFIALIDAEVADQSLRQRLTQALDAMALEELAAQQMEDLAGFADLPATPTPSADLPHTAPQRPAHPAQSNRQQNRENRQNGNGKQARPVPAIPIRSATRPADTIDELVSGGKGLSQEQFRAGDFCNTSPDAHERRTLNKVSG